MADPRNATAYYGSSAEYWPFKIDGVSITYDATQKKGSASIDKAVALSGNGTVRLALDGDLVIGRLELVEADGFCNVQVGGGTVLPGGNAAVLTVGRKLVGALDAGGVGGCIRAVPDPAATYAQAAATDSARGKHFILDSSTASAVVVCLDM